VFFWPIDFVAEPGSDEKGFVSCLSGNLLVGNLQVGKCGFVYCYCVA